MEKASAVEKRYYAALTALVAVTCWVIPAARSGLWLDETATYWMVKDGFRDTVARALSWSGTSPAYYLLAWLAVKLGGVAEVAMRMPSIVAMAFATWLLYRLGTRLLDQSTGLVAAMVFACLRFAAFAAADARPYTLAMLALVAHVLFLARWMESGGWLDAALCVFFGALTAYVHILIAPGFVAPALWALWQSKRRLALATMWAAIGALLAPLAVYTYQFGKSGHHSWVAAPSGLNELLEIIAPPSLVACVLAGLLLAYLIAPKIQARWTPPKPVFLMLTGWAVFVPVLYFLVARLTPNKIFAPRYVLSSAPATALLVACIIRSFRPEWVQRVMATGLAMLTIAAFGAVDKFKHAGEDWRGAVAAERSAIGSADVPFLFQSNFPEAFEPAQFNDPSLRDVLLAPLIRYPAAGRIVPLPVRLDEKFIDQLLENDLARCDRFVLSSNPTVELYLRARLAPREPAIESLGEFGSVNLWMFRLHAPRYNGASGQSP